MVSRIIEKKGLFLVPGVFLMLSLQGCLATRGWVTEQILPLSERVSAAETRLGQTEAKADEALSRLDHLRLERRFVLDLKEGATFAFNSDDLTAEARSEIEGFLSDLQETEDAVFLVAGHTDNLGLENYNYELGQRRASSVARYLLSHRGIDPSRVTAVSYGESSPLADNSTGEGRRRNRRVEILVYRDAITSSPERTAERTAPEAGVEGGTDRVGTARDYEIR